MLLRIQHIPKTSKTSTWIISTLSIWIRNKEESVSDEVFIEQSQINYPKPFKTSLLLGTEKGILAGISNACSWPDNLASDLVVTCICCSWELKVPAGTRKCLMRTLHIGWQIILITNRIWQWWITIAPTNRLYVCEVEFPGTAWVDGKCCLDGFCNPAWNCATAAPTTAPTVCLCGVGGPGDFCPGDSCCQDFSFAPFQFCT